MSFSNTYETHVLNYVFTNTSVTRPTAWYVALFTSNPAEDASGTEVSTSGTAYARQTVAFTVSGNLATNSGAVEFPTATGSGFGTVTHIGVYTASTSGDLIAYSALSASKAISAGDVFRIPAGDLDITLD
jgi:hypothetical protein|tara:strand:- start:335 stop:724 length:390 start_codon:yes stop_codon:yes gene_type:complete